MIANALLYAATDTVTPPTDPSGVVPEPTSLLVWSLLGTLGIATGYRRRRRAA